MPVPGFSHLADGEAARGPRKLWRWRWRRQRTIRVRGLSWAYTAAEPMVVAKLSIAIVAITATIRPEVACMLYYGLVPLDHSIFVLSRHQSMWHRSKRRVRRGIHHRGAFKTRSPVAQCDYRCVDFTEDVRIVDHC